MIGETVFLTPNAVLIYFLTEHYVTACSKVKIFFYTYESDFAVANILYFSK